VYRWETFRWVKESDITPKYVFVSELIPNQKNQQAFSMKVEEQNINFVGSISRPECVLVHMQYLTLLTVILL